MEGSLYDNPQLQSTRGAYESAERAATQAESSAISLPTMLKEALNKKFSADNPLVQGREQALQNYLTVAERAPLDVTAKSAGGNSDVVYSPLEQSSLIGAKRATAMAPLSTANYLLGLAEGGIADVVDSTSRAGQAEASRLRGNASLARQSYTDLFSELAARAEEERRRKDDEFRERQFQESIRQFNVGQSGKGGGFDLSGLLSLMGGNVQGTKDTRPSLDSFIYEDSKKQAAPKVNLSGTVKAAQNSGSQQIASRGNAQWALQPIADAVGNWLRGWNAPQSNFASASQLGFR
jgi:hypothetical protein